MQVGFSRIDVTPQLGTLLTGYYTLRISDGVLDPIQLNAIALTEGEETAVVITGDFMYMTEPAVTPIRALIEKECGIPADHILMQAIHQHTSTTPGNAFMAVTDDLYNKMLERKYVDVVNMALADRKEAKISIAQKETAEPISFVRRYRMKDGSCKTNPKPCNNDILHPLGNADNTVRLVKIEREGAKDIALVGFATHPDVIGGTKFSADWPGWVRRLTEQALPDVSCILVNGCQGDTNHFDPNKPRFAKDDYEGKYAHSRKMGQLITDVVTELWNKTEETEVLPISADVKMISIPSNTKGVERVEECKKLLELYQQGLPLPENLDLIPGEFRRIARMENLQVLQKIPVSMVAFGKIVLIGYGGEPFTEYADVLREAEPDLFILTACNGNGAQGYLPSIDAFEEGGYEARTTNFTEITPPTLQGVAKDMIREHKAKI